MCLYYGVFERDEEERAFAQLLKLVRDFDDHIDVGVLGARVIFHVLTRFGYSDLAYKMITREDYPSYGNWLKRGATTLWENFMPDTANSMNHHFWGDISAWFIKCLAGIVLNPNTNNVNEIKIAPHFVNALDTVSAYHLAPAGKISVSWRREGQAVTLETVIPNGTTATAELPEGFCFENGKTAMRITSGSYIIVKTNLT